MFEPSVELLKQIALGEDQEALVCEPLKSISTLEATR